MSIPKLDSQWIRIIGFSNVSFANNRGNLTQIDFIAFIVDKYDKGVPVQLNRIKLKDLFDLYLLMS